MADRAERLPHQDADDGHRQRDDREADAQPAQVFAPADDPFGQVVGKVGPPDRAQLLAEAGFVERVHAVLHAPLTGGPVRFRLMRASAREQVDFTVPTETPRSRATSASDRSA